MMTDVWVLTSHRGWGESFEVDGVFASVEAGMEHERDNWQRWSDDVWANHAKHGDEPLAVYRKLERWPVG